MSEDTHRPDTVHLVFDDDFTDSIQPGSLDHLDQLESIVWGSSMTDLIQPGVIPDRPLRLLFPLTYTHPTDSSILPEQTLVYLRTTNVSIAPTDRPFYLWEAEATTITIPKLGLRTYTYTQTDYFSDEGYQPIFTTELIPHTHLDTTPEPSIFQLLASLSQRPDTSAGNTGLAGSVLEPMPEPIISMQLLQQLAVISRSNAASKLDACAQRVANEILKHVQTSSEDGTLHHGIEYTYACSTDCDISDLVSALAMYVPPSCVCAVSAPDGSITVCFSYKP